MKSSLYLFAEKEGIDICEHQMPSSKLKGLYSDGLVILSNEIETESERNCILAEELGHYSTNHGKIIDNSLNSDKQEKLARYWAFEKLVPLLELIAAFDHGCRNRYEICDYLNVTEEFLEEALKAYTEKYGIFYQVDDHIIYFEPLGIMEVRNF